MSPFTQFWGSFSIGYGVFQALLLWNVDPFGLAIVSKEHSLVLELESRGRLPLDVLLLLHYSV